MNRFSCFRRAVRLPLMLALALPALTTTMPATAHADHGCPCCCQQASEARFQIREQARAHEICDEHQLDPEVRKIYQDPVGRGPREHGEQNDNPEWFARHSDTPTKFTKWDKNFKEVCDVPFNDRNNPDRGGEGRYVDISRLCCGDAERAPGGCIKRPEKGERPARPRSDVA